MDSSDVTAKLKAKAIYTQLLEKLKAENPTGDCEKLCNCTSTKCVKKFPSYEIKQTFEKGAKTCPCAPETE
jgi:hypothetical protein